jgi:hypothetical protein
MSGMFHLLYGVLAYRAKPTASGTAGRYGASASHT